MIASTFFDLVVGLDMHFEMVPTPAPVPTPFPHPFMGMVFDPGGLVAGLIISNAIGAIAGAPPKGPVLVNFIPATNTGTDVKNKMVLPHFVIPPGTMWTPMPKAPKPKIGAHAAPAPDLPVAPAGDAVLMMGSKTVAIMGSNAVRLGDLAMSCSEPVRLPSSVVMAIPKGPLVLMGGPPAIDWQQAMGALLRSKWVSNHLHGLVSRIKNARVRNFMHRAVCFLTGHPVDVATGRVLTSATDFELPGPLPLKFERNYASSWSDRDSVVGFGWSHSLDQAVWLERGKVVYRAEDGREIEFDTFDFPDHAMRKGDTCYDPFNRLALRSLGQFRWEIENADGLTHEFAPVPGDSRRGYARLITQRTRDGHTIQLAYDAQGCLEWVTDSGGRRILFGHDENGRLTRVALPHPREQKWVTHARYVYSPEGDLVEVHDALGNAARWAYEGHLLVRETDRTGLSFYFGYDGVGSDAYCIRTWGDGGIYDHEILYDKQNHVTAVTNSLGHTTTYFANVMNAVVKVMDPLGGETKYEYDEALRKTAETDPLGSTTCWSYDERGNCVTREGPEGETFSWQYNEREQPVSARDPAGGLSLWTYDSLGRLAEQQNAAGEKTLYEYRDGLLSAVVEPGGARTEVGYDDQKGLRWVRLQNGAETRYKADRLGRTVELRDSRGARQWLEHDATGRVVRVEEADGNIRSFQYDPEGNLIQSREQHGSTQLSYTGFHKLARWETAGEVLQLRYDTEGQLQEIENEEGEVFRYKLDACGRAIEEADFSGRKRTFTRDRAGNVLAIHNAGSGRTELVRDAAGRVIRVRYHDGGEERFSYRADGALEEAANQDMTVRFELDPVGRVLRELQGEHWIQSSYDLDGHRTLMESSLGAREAVLRDALGGARTIEYGPPINAWKVDFKRDAFGLELERHLPGGVVARWERDELGRPRSHQVTVQGRRARARQYRWSVMDQLQSLAEAGHEPTVYQYDGRARLIAARYPDGRVQHRSTSPGGRLFRSPRRHDRTYGSGGQLRAVEGARHGYDVHGNLATRVDPEGGQWCYAYNGAGMLKEVKRPDGEVVSFQYDALGRRIGKQSSRGKTQYLWDGDNLLHEVSGAEKVVTWLFEPDGFSPLAKIQEEQRYAFVTDHTGAPLQLYDERGAVSWEGELDTYGKPIHGPTGRTDCPWRWPGQYEDEETQLYYNRFRYYEPEAGQYISPDPIGLFGGLRPYAYPSNPLARIDPLGLTDVDPRTINFSQRTVGSGVHEYTEAMGGRRWDWSRSGPLRVMNIDGQLVSYDNRRLMAAQNAGLRTVPVEVVNPSDIMPGSQSTWAKKFQQRFNDRRNIAAGGPVPRRGLKEQPEVVSKGCD